MSLPHLRVIITIHQVFNDVIIVLLFTSLVYHSQSQNNIIMNYFILKFFYQRTVVQIYKQFFELTIFFVNIFFVIYIIFVITIITSCTVFIFRFKCILLTITIRTYTSQIISSIICSISINMV